MESSSSSSNPSTTIIDEEEVDLIFLDAPDEFYYDCFPLRQHCSLRRRKSSSSRKLVCSGMVEEPSLSSDVFEVVEKSSFVEKSNDDVIESSKVLIDLKENDFDVIDSSKVMDPGPDPFQETIEESTVTTMSYDDRGDEHAVSGPDATDWSLLGFLVGLVIKAIEVQVSLMISVMTFPSWLLQCFSLLVFDPFRTVRFGRRFLFARVGGISDLVLSPLTNRIRDTKDMVSVVCKFGWGFFWAVYVCIVLFGLLVSALMFGGVVINRIADKPFVVKESLNFDYTKNSPEAFVPISSYAGVSCDGSCEESNEMGKIWGTRVIPRDQKLEITLEMTLPESVYNKNLGMFQVRVDFLSADGQRLASIRRPCMLRFRSEPIRLVQTMFKVVPLVTGYVSEIQTLSLKLNGFVEKDIPTACLKIMIEQRAEFRPGAGIPELYEASLSVESDLPFLKKIIWKWRKTLFVWISMSVFVTELLFALVCCRPLIIPRTQGRDRPPPSNPTASRL